MIRNITKVSVDDTPHYNDGQSLRVALELFGVSANEVSKALGVTPQAMVAFKRTKKFNMDRLEQLSEFFGMSVESFRTLNRRALSEAMQMDMDALVEHLVERHPGDRARIKRLANHLQKAVEIINDIEAGK